jgi:hypothetical protein
MAVQKVLNSVERMVAVMVANWAALKAVWTDYQSVEKTGQDLVDLWVWTRVGHLACWWVELRDDRKVEHSAA